VTMKKRELLAMRQLYATTKMVATAKEDVPQKVTVNTYWGTRQELRQKYHLYMRCCIENDILKASLFYPDNLRVNGRQPSYEIYIDRSTGRFITYDCINSKWREAKVDRLERSQMWYESNVWVSSTDSKAIETYLGPSDKKGYEAILEYQQKQREEARIRRYKKETNAWDADMALTPTLPKDWERWVAKVGIPQNYIFYEYRRGGAKTGYCTYCEKDVPLGGKPRHNKTGRCPCCRHKVTYKSVGKFGRLWTGRSYVYLMQRCKDGFVIREFTAERFYNKESYQTPALSINEIRRVICDKQAVPLRAYYWGDYKHKAFRWISSCICSPSYYAHYGYGGSEN